MKKTTTPKKNDGRTNRNNVIAVVIKQYGTGLYRTCVSLDKGNLTFISSHKDEWSANETINRFWRVYDEGQLKTTEDISMFINSVSPEQAPPMPPLTPAPVEQVFTPLAA